jgi:hypothetical protein
MAFVIQLFDRPINYAFAGLCQKSQILTAGFTVLLVVIMVSTGFIDLFTVKVTLIIC